MPDGNLPAVPACRPSSEPAVVALTLALLLGACYDAGPEISQELEPVAWLRGPAVTVVGEPAEGATLAATWGPVQGSAATASDGAFEMGLTAVPETLGHLEVDPGTDMLIPAWTPLPAEAITEAVALVLLPATWTVRAGPHAGSSVDIHPADAADARGVAPSYWGLSYPFSQVGAEQAVTDSTLWTGHLATWPPGSFPVDVAIDRSGGAVNAADSSALWSALHTLEGELGRTLFTPARLEDLPPPDPDRGGAVAGALIVRLDATLAGQSVCGRAAIQGSVTWLRSEDVSAWSGGPATRLGVVSEDIEAATVRIRDAPTLHDDELVMHEVMHSLGVEHGCAWNSIQTYTEICPELARSLPTINDIAYLELLERAHAQKRALGTLLGILPAIWPARGLTPIPIP